MIKNLHLLDAPGVNPDFREKALRLLQSLEGQGFDILITEVMRSVERQRALYAQGRTDAALLLKGYTKPEIAKHRAAGYAAAKAQVTWILTPRYHGRGLAMDLAPIKDGKVCWDGRHPFWAAYGKECEAAGLTWGGNWAPKNRDMPHCQYDPVEKEAQEA
jgi:peptidoglycan L-alanyl-D-glutamate endopeptidase CwlK